jgi:mono/diheme cytochrome c family protein
MRMLVAATTATLLFSGAAVRADGGADVFKKQCARCHGETGNADTPMGKAVQAKPLAGNATVQQMTEAQVVERVRTNEKHSQMVRSLAAPKLDTVAGYVKTLAGTP